LSREVEDFYFKYAESEWRRRRDFLNFKSATVLLSLISPGEARIKTKKEGKKVAILQR
jgi:hypothetical protein